MNFKKMHIYSLKPVLEQLKKVGAKPKFHYGVIKNLKLIQPELEALEELRESLQIAGWDGYVQKEKDLLTEYAEKDEEGNPILTGPNSVRLNEETKEEFYKKKEELDEENKELIEKYTKNQKEFDSILSEDVEVKLYKIDIDNVPEDLPNGGDVTELFMDVGILE